MQNRMVASQMSGATLDMRFTSVLKDYPAHQHERWEREVFAYQNLAFATPGLLCHNERWLEMERLTPILDLGPGKSRKYAEPLRALLQRVHDAGWWHGDAALVNVVIHPVRGPLLIDWENMRPAQGSISYDLYGARSAGVTPFWEVPGGDGVFWGGPWSTCPGRYWK